jgi:hypothetical protein
MAARLKVFVTSDGFTDYVVATSSRPKALAAWGVRQDVFKEGQAHETDDPALVKAATAQPGVVLRRPAGSRATLSKVKAKAAPKPKPDAAKKKIAALEARLAALDAAHDKALANLEARRTQFDEELAVLKAKQSAARQALEDDLSAARSGPG